MNADDIRREHTDALNTLDFHHVVDSIATQAQQGDSPACPVWPGLCVDTNPGHIDHVNGQNYITDRRGERLIDVYFLQFTDETGSGPAKICIGGVGSEDYDPSEVHAKTAEIRRLLDVADAMADQVLATRKAGA